MHRRGFFAQCIGDAWQDQEAARRIARSDRPTPLDLHPPRHRGRIRLDALTRLKGDSTRLLAVCHGWFKLVGLQSLDAEAARELPPHRGQLSLNGLARIDREAAESLTKHDGDLCLSGLAELAPPVAAALACQRHALHLCGLQVIDDQIVTAITRFQGSTLSLDGLTTLEIFGPEAADALRSIPGGSVLRVAR